ncbi:hypothetical protein BVH75_30285 (plasmid) [Bacillus thuringiensis]|nr:hypothetical protein BVH75_30285 [Bacillus thuringiensis]
MGMYFFFYIMCSLRRLLYIDIISKKFDVKIVEKDSVLKSVSTKKIDITEEQIYKGDLLLVNKDYPIKKNGIRSDIININQNNELIRGYVVFDRNVRLSKGVEKNF